MAEAAARQRGRLLVFVHIPKTAGTTLRTVLGMNEPGPRSRALGNVFKGGGGISEELIQRLRRGRGPELAGVKLVRGHVPLGIRELLPKYLPKERELTCFTFLREPADRTLSHFFAIRKLGGGHGLPPLAAEATLEDALSGGYLHDNLQTRMLSGLPEPFGEVDQAMLEQAKRNLSEGIAFFGLTERFDESLVLAKQRLGLRSILYRTPGRVNASRPRGDEIPRKLVQAAERANRYDVELYDYARQIFDDAPERGQVEFDIELAALQAAKADGPIQTDTPPPAGYTADPETWPPLLHARAHILRLEREVAESEIRSAAYRSRTRGLKQRLENMEAIASNSKELVEDAERLDGNAPAAEALAQVVEPVELVEPVEEEEVAQPVEVEEPTEPVEPPARARPKREARRSGERGARTRPKRNAKRGDSERAEGPRGRPRPRRRGGGGRRASDGG
jgi:hypothetical protein